MNIHTIKISFFILTIFFCVIKTDYIHATIIEPVKMPEHSFVPAKDSKKSIPRLEWDAGKSLQNVPKHHDRLSCGKCGYTESPAQKKETEAEKKP